MKERYFEAVRLKEAGDYEAAKGILIKLSEENPESVATLAVLGDVYWDMQDCEEAVKVFRRATELSPKTEGLSLALFHCLWDLRKYDEALEEVKRFQTISDSEDYRKIVKEINEKW